MSKLLSIIISVYNVEEFLERCIRSLEQQDIHRESYEIIVINDGSPDNSREVVIRLMEEFSNLILIDQSNKGVSMARNAGIEVAVGRYIVFIDPDDFVLPRSFANSLNTACENSAEVAFLGYYFLDVSEKRVAEVTYPELSGKLYSGIDAYFLSRGNGKIDPDRSWAILFSRDFLINNKLKYTPQIPYLEDGEFMARTLCLAERCLFTGLPFYQRTTRPGSATNSNLFYQDRTIAGFIKATSNLVAFRNSLDLTDKQKLFLNQPIAKFTTLVLIPNCNINTYKKFLLSVKNLKKLGFARIDTRGCNKQYKFEAVLFNISPFLFFVHRALHAPLLRYIKP